MITTTETYKGINRNEPTNLEAMILDSVDCLRDGQPAYLFKAEQVEMLKACVNENLTVDDFGDYYGVYYKLNKKAGADYRKENF